MKFINFLERKNHLKRKVFKYQIHRSIYKNIDDKKSKVNFSQNEKRFHKIKKGQK